MPETAVAATSITDILDASRLASRTLATLNANAKNVALEAIATSIVAGADRVIAANELDLANGRENGMSAGLQDRLRLDEARLASLASAVREIIGLVDPVGQNVRGSTLPNGINLAQVRVPFGVVGAIYEARPNVTIDIAALALKSGTVLCCAVGLPRSTQTAFSSSSFRMRWRPRGFRARLCRQSTSSAAMARSS